MEKLIRVDRNGTKYYEDNTCPKCGGSGYISYYGHVEGGRCFLCEGSGTHITKWRVCTPEYEKKLADRRLEKARKTSAERNKAYFKSVGFSEDGNAWVVLGDTYSIKEELKSKGAKFMPIIGWHFDHEVTEYPCFELPCEEVMVEWDDYTRKLKSDVELFDIVEAYKEKFTPKSSSKYVGEVGQRLEVKVTCISCHHYDTYYTYSGERHYIYKFKDEQGNTLIWNTSSYTDIEEGASYTLKGTVKEHKEYKGEKETVLSRCKIA